MESIGKKIKKLRKENKLSQEGLAFQAKVARQTVSRWELDVAFPTMENLVELSRIFNVKIDYFTEGLSDSTDTPMPILANEEIAVAKVKQSAKTVIPQIIWKIGLWMNSLLLPLFIVNAVIVGFITSSYGQGDVVVNSAGLDIWHFYFAVAYCVALAVSEVVLVIKVIRLKNLS
jgi:transcriptional regulator with XRE-family HTH domain